MPGDEAVLYHKFQDREVQTEGWVRRKHLKTTAKKMVGTGRFELPTPRTPSECSTRLSHVPIKINNLQDFPPNLTTRVGGLRWAFLSLSANANFCRTSHRQRWSGTSTASNGYSPSPPHKKT